MNAETIREPTIGEGSRREPFTGRAGTLSESFETRKEVVVVRASRVGNGGTHHRDACIDQDE